MELYWLICAGILGLLVGSFLNVVIYRLPLSLINNWRSECRSFLTENDGLSFDDEGKDEKPFNIAFPNSHCPSCKEAIPAWCNIPVISYLILKGKCLRCKQAISLRYPLIELLTACATVWCVYVFGLNWQAAAAILFSWALISLIFIDIDHQLLPDNVTLPLLWLGLIVNSQNYFTDLHSSVLGAVLGYLSLWTVFWAFKLITGKEGMGFGDFKLLAALGAWMGWQHLPSIIIMSSLVGAILGITLILLAKQEKSKPMPFGPYLAIAGWIVFFWGDAIQHYYLQWLSPV